MSIKFNLKAIGILLLLAILENTSIGQTDLSGKYWTMSCGFTHGYYLRLFPDSTAHFTPIYETAEKYMTGVWYTNKDTLIVELSNTDNKEEKFEYFLIKDTLRLEKINKALYVEENTLYRQEAYYDNGDIKYKIEYGLCKENSYCFNGRLYYYYPGKKIKCVVDYKNNVKSGIEMNYSWYGYATGYGTWAEGKKEGVWVSYDSDFNLTTIQVYKKGRLKSTENNPICFPGWDKETLEKLYK